jgi:hypothetical protein
MLTCKLKMALANQCKNTAASVQATDNDILMYGIKCNREKMFQEMHGPT